MGHSFSVYIDESGVEGDEHGRGGTEWFVMAALVCRAEIRTQTLHAVPEFVREIGKPPDFRVKYDKLKSKQQIAFARHLARKPARFVAVIVHKPSVTNKAILRDHRVIYNYVGKYLVERISWVCRDMMPYVTSGNGKAKIIFSESRKVSYVAFQQYVRRLQVDLPQASQIIWNHIDAELIEAIPHKDSYGCQLADVAASALGYSIERKDLGITDDRAARELAPIRYIPPSGRVFGNGIKLWPREAEHMIGTDPRFRWFVHYYETDSEFVQGLPAPPKG